MSELRWILLLLGAVLLGGIYLWGRRTRGQAAGDDDFDDGRVEALRGEDPFPVPHPQPLPDAALAEQAVPGRWREDEWTGTVTDLPEIRFDADTTFDDPLEPRLEEGEPVLPAAVDEDIVAGPVAIRASPAASPALTDRQPSVHREPVQREDTSLSAAGPSTPPTAPAFRESAPARRKPAEKRKIVAFRLSAPAGHRYDGGRLRAVLERNGLSHGKYGIFHRLQEDASAFSVASMVEPGAFDLQTMSESQFAGVTLFALLPGPLPGGEAFDLMLACARDLEETLGGELHDERGAALNAHRAAVLRDEILDFEHLLGAVTPAD